jgi:hypothetical protein
MNIAAMAIANMAAYRDEAKRVDKKYILRVVPAW